MPCKREKTILTEAIKTRLHAGLSLALMLLLGACATGPLRDGSYPEVVESGISAGLDLEFADTPPLDEVLADADAILASGESLPAELAATLIEAATKEGRWEVAEATVRGTPSDSMAIDEYARFSIAVTAYYNARKQFRNADRWLHGPRMQRELPLMSARDQIMLGLQRAESLFGLQQFSASAMERIFLHDLLEHPQLRDSNADGIWRALQYMDDASLQRELRRAKSRSYRAWLELAILEREGLNDPASRETALDAWRQRWPNHPASLRTPGSGDREQFSYGSASSIAVILPVQGPLARAGKALRDGIAAAHFAAAANASSVPRLLFLDSSSAPIASLYLQAEQLGAEFVIGPLHKDKVKALFTMPTSLPVLTLNFVPNALPPPDNIVQFGLAAEDEAAQLAEVAQQRGARSVQILHVSKSWAERAAWAFSERWLELGGMEPGIRALSSIENYSKEIASSFALHESQARHRQMQNLLSRKLEFKPRRRQDVDLVVMFANPSEARAIVPLLAYHYAGELPVMGSSHIYDHNSPPAKNRDLNGVVFNEMPWILDGSGRFQPLPPLYSSNKNLSRLFAMGVDAYRLQSRLASLRFDPLQQLVANTGNLSILENRVLRQLPLATIEAGRAQRWQGDEPDEEDGRQSLSGR